MSLDDQDLHILGLKGNAKKLSPEFFGEKIESLNNAQKYVAGVRKYLQYKQTLDPDDVPIHEKQSFAKDGSRFIERLVLLSESDMSNPSSLLTKMGLDPSQWDLIDAFFDGIRLSQILLKNISFILV